MSQIAENHTANNFGLNFTVNNSGGGTGSLIVTNGGMALGLAQANGLPENNSLTVSNGGYAYIKGNLTLGSTVAQGNAETNSITLTGGQLVVNGTIGAATAAGAQDLLFNWTGGQLAAATITTGSGSVAGLITANLLTGYTPAATTAFTILPASGGLVANPANLGYAGYIPVSTNGVVAGGKYFQVIVAGNNLILTNYGVTPPVLAAKFSPTNTVGVAPVSSTFIDSSTGIITNRYWVFGDGGTTNTTATTVGYTYKSIGIYTNVLTVTDIFGNSSSATGVVHATAAALSLTWQGGLNGNSWDASTLNWFNGSTTATYADPDYVTFDDTGSASPAIALNSIVQPSTVTFYNYSKN